MVSDGALWLDRNEHRVTKAVAAWSTAWLVWCFTWLTLAVFEQSWLDVGVFALGIAIHTSHLRWSLRRLRSPEDPS